MKGELSRKIEFFSEKNPSYSGFRRKSFFVLTLSFEDEDATYSKYLKEAVQYITAEIDRIQAEEGGS